MVRAGIDRPKTILLVEDYPDIMFVLRRHLEAGGYRVVEACDGSEAVEEAARVCPDLILIDLALPVLDGFCAARRLRRLPGTRDVPVVAVSALGGRGVRGKALAAGCDDFIEKPVDFGRLDEVVARYLAPQ